jgi:hypothetical protein
MTDERRNRIVAALAAEESPLRDEAVATLLEQALSRRIRDLVDLVGISELVLAALSRENVSRIVTRHVEPGFQRYLVAVAASEEVVGALVPGPARDKIRDVAKESKIPHGKWTEGMVDPALARKLFAPVWINLLSSFGSRLPLPGMGAAAAVSNAVGKSVGGLAGRITKSVQERAEKLADAGRNVMGGIGAEVERRLQASARDFSDGAAEIFRDALRERLKSDEGRALLEQMASQAVDHVMKTELAAIHEDVAAVPVDAILALVPEVVAHAASGDFVRQIVSGEIAAFLAVEGDKTLSELLTELSIGDEVRAALKRHVGPVAKGWFGSPEFASLMDRLLAL